MTYNFRAWLEVQPDDKEYDYMNCQGNCAMGQYMQSIGEKWDMPRYNEHVLEEFGFNTNALAQSKTFGELKSKVLEPV